MSCSFLIIPSFLTIHRSSNVLLCNKTDRVSFWFVVTNSSTKATTFPRSDVEAAIRMNRNRINSAFLLSDDTLQFLKVSSTLAPSAEQSLPNWLIAFGVVLCITLVGILFLIVSGIRQDNKKIEEREALGQKCDTAITMENGIPCDSLGIKAGQINGVYTAADDERFTPL
uniref:Collectrin-like domain-containing protein n=1 Tax=Varanus komodoensis TaxID=61221 RepID=A0A8D2Q8Y7_VARKO